MKKNFRQLGKQGALTKDELLKMIDDGENTFYGETLLEQEAMIRTYHFTWKFPFIKIVDFVGSIKDNQKLVDKQFNTILDNRSKIINKSFLTQPNKVK